MTANVAPNPIPLEREELIVRLKWLIRVRWLFGGGVWAAGAALAMFPVGRVSGGFIAAVGAAILGYNWLFWFLERRIKEVRPEVLARRAPVAALGQIVLDLLALTLVLHAIGGIENPLFVYYVFHMVVATLLLPVREVFAVAGLAILLFALLAVAEMKGWVPHTNVSALQRHYRDPWFVTLTLLAFASALVIAVGLGTAIARTLRAREADIVRLTAEVGARAQALEHANASLQAADQAKTQYFRKVSHDLKAPLAAQQSLLRALLVELPDLAPGPRSRIERAIVRGDELLALLTNLLVLSRARDATRQPQCEMLDPVERLRPVLEAQELLAREKGLAWSVEAPEFRERLCVEPGILTTIAENLLSNAIKYTPKGGEVAVSLREHDEGLVLEVRDTGIGMSSEDLARLGEEFFRTRQARQSGVPGTGLGMAIVRSMVNLAGGRLDVRSEPGRGTTVSVTLPRTRTDGPPAASARDDAGKGGSAYS